MDRNDLADLNQIFDCFQNTLPFVSVTVGETQVLPHTLERLVGLDAMGYAVTVTMQDLYVGQVVVARKEEDESEDALCAILDEWNIHYPQGLDEQALALRLLMPQLRDSIGAFFNEMLNGLSVDPH